MSTGKRLEEFPSKYEDLANNASSKLQRDFFFVRARKLDCLCRNIVVHIAFNGNAHSGGAYIYRHIIT